MLRESGASSTPRLLGSAQAHRNTGSSASRTMTAECAALSASTTVLRRMALALRRDAGPLHGSRRGRVLPGRVGDMDRRESRTFDVAAIALFGAQIAVHPGDLAARQR